MILVSTFLKGIAVGLANIIPGVSGGTMLLLLGIYERVIRALRNIGLDALRQLKDGRRGLVTALRQVDALFVGVLALGALFAVWRAAKVLLYLLDEHHDPTYGFFFGLVLLSVVVPYRMIKHKRASGALFCALGVVAVVGLTFAIPGEQRLASEQQKAAIKAAKAEAAKVGHKANLPDVEVDAAKLGLFFGSGAVAIAAMILPGISGSFMLLLMGVYFDLLAAITNLNLPLLGVFGLGCIFGLLTFTRLLSYLLERHHDPTMAFLLGLVGGSLWAIWPFKTFGMAGDTRVDLANALPTTLGTNEALTLVAALAGCAIVAGFIWLETRMAPPPAER